MYVFKYSYKTFTWWKIYCKEKPFLLVFNEISIVLFLICSIMLFLMLKETEYHCIFGCEGVFDIWKLARYSVNLYLKKMRNVTNLRNKIFLVCVLIYNNEFFYSILIAYLNVVFLVLLRKLHVIC